MIPLGCVFPRMRNMSSVRCPLAKCHQMRPGRRIAFLFSRNGWTRDALGKWGLSGPGHPPDMCFLQVVPEIIEDPNEVAIKIGDDELAQLPGFVLGFGDDFCLRLIPLCEEFVYLSLAFEIEPEKNRADVSVLLPK